MKIRTLKIENFRSIKNLQIELNGGNATITGQNGTGKTTIIDAVCWLLSNKMSDGKTGESANLHDSGKVTAVEMVFTDGLKIRRECDGKSLYFVQGIPSNGTDFKIQVASIFKDAVPTLLTPFNFCRLHYSERRNTLLKLFAKDIDIDLTDFTDIAAELQTMTPEQIIKVNTYNRKQLEKELATIPARIDELQKSILTVDTAEINAEIETLKEKIALKLEDVKKCQSASAKKLEPYNQSVKLDSEARKLEDKVSELRAEYRNNEIDLNRLRKEYEQTQKAATGICPTCGSKVPAANLDKIQARLNEIIIQGKAISKEQETLKKLAEDKKNQAEELRRQAAELKQKYDAEFENSTFDELNAALLERDELQAKLSDLKLKLAESERTNGNSKRIEELKEKEVSIADDIADYDKKIYQAEMYIRRKIALTEEKINSQFEFVQFKMFEDFKTVDGIKECCEPMLNGVPYAALSKGEQLKASLDILNALQKAYGVELPVFIDDAESYTSNSLIDIPNQKILLRATEGVKKLKVRLEPVNDDNADENLFEGSLTA